MKKQDPREFGNATHEQLWKICKRLPTDFSDSGRSRDTAKVWQDCSCGCLYYHRLDGGPGGDWGVCWNPKSPRKGLLTFEHQGCPKWTYDSRWDKV